MHYKRRKDNSHADIEKGLRQAGFSVADTSRLGHDFPDLVIGKHGIDAKVECKTEDRRKNGVKTAQELLSEGQEDFASQWKGSPVIVAYSLEEALYKFNSLLRGKGWVK